MNLSDILLGILLTIVIFGLAIGISILVKFYPLIALLVVFALLIPVSVVFVKDIRNN